MPLKPHAMPAARLRAKVASPVVIGDRAFLLARRGGSDRWRAAGGACVGNGGWNKGDEENADDSKPVTQAEGGETKRDASKEDKCCRESDGIQARGDDPCSSHDGVCLGRGEGAPNKRQGEHGLARR